MIKRVARESPRMIIWGRWDMGVALRRKKKDPVKMAGALSDIRLEAFFRVKE